MDNVADYVRVEVRPEPSRTRRNEGMQVYLYFRNTLVIKGPIENAAKIHQLADDLREQLVAIVNFHKEAAK